MVQDENIPFYYRIWATIRSRIQSGMYDLDGTLPSTEKLAEEFGVSVITIKKALGSLVEEGLLERRRGVGTRIKIKRTNKVEMPLATANFWDWFDDRDHIIQREFKIISIDEVALNARLQEKIGLQVGAKLFCLKRVMKVKGEVVSYFVNYFYDTFLEPRLFVKNESRRFLKIAIDNWNDEIVKVKQEVRVTVADLDLAKILMIGFGDPLFHVENTYYGRKDNALVFTQMYHRGDVYSYTGSTDFDKNVINRTEEVRFGMRSLEKEG
jgi:GntR family transcriptional regulator